MLTLSDALDVVRHTQLSNHKAKLSHYRRRLKRLKRGLCPDCGFDLRETPGRCPVCGEFNADPTRK